MNIFLKTSARCGNGGDQSLSHSQKPMDTKPTSTQVHGFCDVSEAAYTGAVYLRMIDTSDSVYTALVTSKT